MGLTPEKMEIPSVTAGWEAASKEAQSSTAKQEKTIQQPAVPHVIALFSPAGGIERQVVALIGSAVTSIEMATFEFTNVYVEKAMLEAVKRGVKVALVLDRTRTVVRQATLIADIEKAGCDAGLISPRKGTMHNKYTIVDGKTVEWGS